MIYLFCPHGRTRLRRWPADNAPECRRHAVACLEMVSALYKGAEKSARKTEKSSGSSELTYSPIPLLPYSPNQLLIICLCSSPTWWLWRSGCTRSHSELGRKTLQRQWYFVSRRGRVGRCQVCQVHKSKHLLKPHAKHSN